LTISRSTAARLCTGHELELVEASYPAGLEQLTPGRLRQKVERARRLRDLYRDRADRQTLAARARAAPQGSRPARADTEAERKAQLFDEALGRFEAQLARTPPKLSKTPGPRVSAAGAGERAGGPAEGRARPSKPARPGAAALKGARTRPETVADD
jgi:hypothetical protein